MPAKKVSETELVDEFASIYTPFLPPIASRMLALLALDGGELTSQDIMTRLGVSAASVSSMGRLLIEYGTVRRRIDPESRRDLFAIAPDAWTHSWSESRQMNLRLVEWATKALDFEDRGEDRGSYLADLRDFSEFLAVEAQELIDRYRARHPQPPGQTNWERTTAD